MRGKRVKALRRLFKERYGRSPKKSEWREILKMSRDGPKTAGHEVTRNEERLFRKLAREHPEAFRQEG